MNIAKPDSLIIVIDNLYLTSWHLRYNTKEYVINSIVGSSRRGWLTLSATSQETDCKPRIGDFNAHYDPSNIIESSVFGNLLYRWMECNNLFQVIDEPTRVI